MTIAAHSSPVPLANPADEVVITGLGIITAMGHGWRANSNGFRDGRTALRPVTAFDVSRQSVQLAGEVDLPESLPTNALPPAQQRRMDRGGRLLLHAAHEALHQADLTAANAPDTLEIVLGTSAGAMAHGQEYYQKATQSGRSRRGQLTLAIDYLIPHQAGLLARAFSLTSPTTVISNACASGANALGHAYQLIRCGRSEMVIAGGYDALCHLVFAGFDSLKALSRTLPKPFDAHRDGLALGEGAAVFVLERRAHAVARGAPILATVAGYGVATDCHHLTQPNPAGLAALQSMRMACHEAGLEPRHIQYINSHGTGTPLNDPAEAAAIAAWADQETPHIAVSSTKGAIGHLLGGAGAVEAAICVMAMADGFLPATANVTTPDPCCSFDLVTSPRSVAVRTTLSNSFGFGGSNATLIFQRDDANRPAAPGPDADQPPPRENPVRPPRPLVITGIGAVSPAGWGVAALVEARQPVHDSLLEAPGALAHILPGYEVRAVPRPVPDRALAGHPRLRRATPVALFAAAAALEALGPDRIAAMQSGTLRAGLIYTLLNGGVSYCGRFYGEVLENPATASPILFPETVFNAAASHLAAYLGIRGPCASLVGDSAQFLAAIDMAALWLDLGHVDLCLVVGAEEQDWLPAAAVDLLNLSVPVAEGAACLVIEPGGSHTQGLAIQTLAIRHPITSFAQRHEAAAAARAALGTVHPSALLVDDCCGHPATDAATAQAWSDWTGPRVSPTPILGHGLSASGAWQCVTACHSLLAGQVAEAVVATTGIHQRAAALHLKPHGC
jgi:3-oxoacyl-[acyl-carrier-protein] synthase II